MLMASWPILSDWKSEWAWQCMHQSTTLQRVDLKKEIHKFTPWSSYHCKENYLRPGARLLTKASCFAMFYSRCIQKCLQMIARYKTISTISVQNGPCKRLCKIALQGRYVTLFTSLHFYFKVRGINGTGQSSDRDMCTRLVFEPWQQDT